MSRVQTMGTSSCATIAISWFKGGEAKNDEYLADKSAYRKKFKLNGDYSVRDFYDSIIVPTRQDLGRSADYPFDMLMDEIDGCDLEGKFIIATLNESQRQAGYWPERLKARGFKAVDKVDNALGQHCTIYTRCNRRVPLPTEADDKEEGSVFD